MLILLAVAAVSLLTGCGFIQPGTELPSVNGYCWHPTTGWQPTPTGTCIYVGPDAPAPATTTTRPEIVCQSTDCTDHRGHRPA